jgi:hypothetical protein
MHSSLLGLPTESLGPCPDVLTGHDATHVAVCPPAGMLGLSWALRRAGQLSFAPRGRLSATALRRSGDHQLAGLKEAGIWERPFTRPQRFDPYGPDHGGVTAPVLFLPSLARFPSSPFGSELPASRFGLTARRFNAQNPSPGFRRAIPISPPAAAPRRGMNPFGS